MEFDTLQDGDVIRCTACPDHGCTGRPVRVRVKGEVYPGLPYLYHDGNDISFGVVRLDGTQFNLYRDKIELIGRRT